MGDQYAGRDLGLVNPAIYRIGRSAYYHQAFYDVTTRTNTVTLPRRPSPAIGPRLGGTR